MNAKRFFILILPALLLIAFSSLELSGFFERGEHAVYDAWLHVKPAVPEREEILYLDVDDLAITQVGVWPWSREIMARGLITLREFESGPTVFDIEYVDASPLAVDGQILDERIPDLFQREFSQINNSVESLIAAVAAGQLSPSDAGEFLPDLTALTEEARGRLLENVREVAQNNDIVLGNAASAHGNAWFTVNLIPDAEEAAPEGRIELAVANTSIQNVTGESSVVMDARGLRPAIEPMLEGGAGAGFPNVVIDEDGTRRRIELLRRYDDEYFGQLVFAPLLSWFGSSGIDVSNDRIVIQEALIPGEESRRDVRIPLAEDGSMLLNWHRGPYIDSFRHLSYYELILHEELLDDLAFNVGVMEEAGYLQYHAGDRNVLDAWSYAQGLVEDALATGDPALLDELAAVRTYVLEEISAFLSGGAEDEILGDITAAIEDPGISTELRQQFQQFRDDVPVVFETTRTIFADLTETRAILAESIPDSFVLIGYTGTGTTDIGVNPFENEYANTGTHGTIVNTVLTGLFIDDLPSWISIAIGALFTLLFVVVSRSRSATTVLVLGFAAAGVVVIGSALLMVTMRLFLPIIAPVLTLLLAAVAQSGYKYVELSRERNHIRNAFNHYLSTDVINEIISDPSRLRLGGEKRVLTAMFTDVKGFSSISETLDPEALVKLLNRYLSEMSDIVLQLRGTIDKFEGDAIISFFGAPVTYDDHANRACQAAVRMKKIESYLNERFQTEELSPHPLATRIGINTGEMVVGNMGTANRMDYTIMGHAVNLAARLEGVNKQYGTWILTSELTHDQTDNAFTARKLDRVRVVGVSEPVRLFEILDESELAQPQTVQLVDDFHHGLELFEGREWGEAGSIFSRLNREFPEDGPSKTFFERSTKFQSEEPPKDWDGVFNLTRK